LERRKSKLIEWWHLRHVDEALVLGAKPAEMARYLLAPAVPRQSAILAEKLADLYQADGQYDLSIQAATRALRFKPTPQQRVRLTLTLCDRLIAAGREADALSLYDDFLKQTPAYPDAVGLYTQMETLATKLRQPRRAEKYARHISELTAAK
jgi:tetratricopeptide (TPR) repeat protein